MRLPSGEVYKMNSADVTRVTENDEEGVDDILKLRDFSEMSLIHTLRVRYFRGAIYTFVGPILISVNPYKYIKGIYSEKTMVSYHLGDKNSPISPHLFSIAESSYSALLNKKNAAGKFKDQSIIISGESGAGKTEATKVVMSYLARITAMDNMSNVSSGSGDKEKPIFSVGELEQRVLNTNPLLEAFGNARTLRNDNSSRFGKFIKIQFGSNGRIIGAVIEKYLLEKTRVIHQTPGERNYHIFYQLIKGASQDLLRDLDLKNSPDDYKYLSGGNAVASIENVSDKDEFIRTCDCMTSIGIDEVDQRNVFSLISGLLHLGNVMFSDDDADGQVGGIVPETEECLELSSRWLGVEPSELITCMTKQNMHVNGATIVKLQSLSQALDKRDSFSKSIYSMIFHWLVDRINATISPSEKIQCGFIGILDIYGFENFENLNSYEQLLINYANEKMQSHFNKHIFQIEQAEYESESIDWSYINFNDNQPCVDLIDGKPFGKTGIFQTLDDSTASGRSDINANFLASLNQSWGGTGSTSSSRHSNYLTPRFNSDQRFGILHYAGEVYYEIVGAFSIITYILRCDQMFY